jgi:hypothetical protein
VGELRFAALGLVEARWDFGHLLPKRHQALQTTLASSARSLACTLIAASL